MPRMLPTVGEFGVTKSRKPSSPEVLKNHEFDWSSSDGESKGSMVLGVMQFQITIDPHNVLYSTVVTVPRTSRHQQHTHKTQGYLSMHSVSSTLVTLGLSTQ